MKSRSFKYIYNSILFKIVIYIIIILTPLISLLIYKNYQTHDSLLKEVESTHKNMLESYIAQIDPQLKNSMAYTLDMANFQYDPKILLTENDDSNIAFTKYRIFTSFSNRLLSNNYIDAFFLYIKSRDYFITATQNNVSSSEIIALKNYVISQTGIIESSNSSLKSSWTFSKIENYNCLINISYSNKDIVTGAYINTDRLLDKFSTKNLSTSTLSFITTDSLNDVVSNKAKDHILVTSQSSIVRVNLMAVLSKQEILKTLPFLYKYILIISILLALQMPLLMLLMKFTVVNPLHKLTKSMAKVRIGDLNHRIEANRSSNEFEIVNTTFNEMMDTVQNLKIHVYEEQIKVQKSQLRTLQLQVNPHFLINSLNMVNNLIQNEDLPTARKLILQSVDYFRYMAKVENDFVPLTEELKHISDYLEIQKIRYKDKFTYSINVNQMIDDMLIPPMLIQNFVENSIKYAIDMSKVIHISISVDYFEVDYYPYAKIMITDTGVGYPISILEKINSGMKLTDSLGEHIGIYNSVQRMTILYNGKATWKFYNNGGAVVELTLPALFKKK
ncbi:MAG: histidine kinase [Neobacillus sp.]